MPRHKDANWQTPDHFNWDHVAVEVLMDIRDELKQLNRLLHCPNFTSIPHKLEAIRKNTIKKRKKGSR